jgi:hypothetical protein
MEDLIFQVDSEVSSLEIERKINETQASMLRSLIKSTESFELMMKLYPNMSVRRQIIKILQDISLKIKIPGHNLPEEISSPLDCFLQGRKKEVQNSRIEFSLTQMNEPVLLESEKL